MFQDKPEWIAHQRKHWLRPDAECWLRPDAHRWMTPEAHRWLLPEASAPLGSHTLSRSIWWRSNARAGISSVYATSFSHSGPS